MKTDIKGGLKITEKGWVRTNTHFLATWETDKYHLHHPTYGDLSIKNKLEEKDKKIFPMEHKHYNLFIRLCNNGEDMDIFFDLYWEMRMSLYHLKKTYLSDLKAFEEEAFNRIKRKNEVIVPKIPAEICFSHDDKDSSKALVELSSKGDVILKWHSCGDRVRNKLTIDQNGLDKLAKMEEALQLIKEYITKEISEKI
jgi:hypothetical protein